MNLAGRAKRALLRRLLPIPVEAAHAEYSVIASATDEVGPSPRLLSTALEAITRASTVSFEAVLRHRAARIDWFDVWPGEHYKLLAGLIQAAQPSVVVEIGTGAGAGVVAMMHALPAFGRLATFDVLGWRSHGDNLLEEGDFADGRLIQYTDDLSHPAGFAVHRNLLASADVLFIDAAKDGAMEARLLGLLETLAFRAPPLVLFDDIRVWNMLRLWRGIRRPKLDLTSFGHWTGTGLVEWTPGAR